MRLATGAGGLANHNCINYRYSGSGALHDWDFTDPGENGQYCTQAVTDNHTRNDDEGMPRAALQGIDLIQNIDIAVRQHLDNGSPVRALLDFLIEKRAGMLNR